MKATRIDRVKQEIDWSMPRLVISDEDGSAAAEIVLAYRDTNEILGYPSFAGVVVGGCGRIGDHSETWNKDAFRPYHGQVTLEND